MSGADTEQFNTLERAVSGDFNDLQSIAARFLSELLKYGTARRGMAGADLPSSWVLGGLDASPSAGNVSIGPGALMQLSDTLSPIPGPLDSNYRLARSDAPTVVSLPSPVVTTFYLIEAQMVSVVTDTQSRDIYNPGTKTFVPALVTKQTERQIAFQVVTGNSSAPAPSGGNWVPIAVVRRPPGSPAVTAADIWDVRPLCEWGSERPNAPARLRRSIRTTNVAASSLVNINTLIEGQRGALAFESFSAIDVTSATYLSPGTSISSASRYYLYLCPYFLTYAPKQVDGTSLSKGVLVLSSVHPTRQGYNSATIPLPAPWSVANANAFTAYYVGTLVRNQPNTGWCRMTAEGPQVTLWDSDTRPMSLLLGPIPASSPLTLSLTPVTATQVMISAEMTGGSGSSNPIGLRLRPTGATGDCQSVWVNTDDVDYRTMTCAYDGSGAIEFACSGTPGGVATLGLGQVGWLE